MIEYLQTCVMLSQDFLYCSGLGAADTRNYIHVVSLDFRQIITSSSTGVLSHNVIYRSIQDEALQCGIFNNNILVPLCEFVSVIK